MRPEERGLDSESEAVPQVSSPKSEPDIDRDDVRFRIDEEEDWEHTLEIYEAIGPEALNWQRIADLLNHQPALRRRMAALNRSHGRV